MEPSNAFYEPKEERRVRALIHRPPSKDQQITSVQKYVHAIFAIVALIPFGMVTVAFVASKLLGRKLKGMQVNADIHDVMMTIGEENKNESLKHRISSTARYIATVRYGNWLSGMAGDRLAYHFMTSDTVLLAGCLSLVRAANFSKLPQKTLGPYTYVANRTQAFDAVVENSGIEQIVILGAGFDTRAHRLKASPSTIFYEVDIAGTQLEKLRVVKSHASDFKGRVVYCEVDFSCQSFMDQLQQRGFDATKKAVFLVEGLSYYLERKDVENIFEAISVSAKGSLVVIDYFEDLWSDADAMAMRPKRLGGSTLSRVLQRAGEPIKFGFKYSESPATFEKFGYKLLLNLGQHELCRVYQKRLESGIVEDAFSDMGHLCLYEVV